MTAPAHIRLAEPEHPADPWQLDLPSDPVAAAEYLRGIERARREELEAIRTLRRRIQGDRHDVRISLRTFGIACSLFVLVAAVAASSLFGGASPAMRDAAHAGHAAPMGSGIAVTLASEGPALTRDTAEPGSATFVLRNDGDDPAMLILARTGSAGTAASSPIVEPGERVEWATELEVGSYELQSHTDGGTPVPGPTLRVA